MEMEETKIGRLVHKIEKQKNVGANTPGVEFLRSEVFSGDNGLTGDGTSKGSSTAQNFNSTEPGGTGYVTEFIVFNRPGISAEKLLTECEEHFKSP